MINFWQGLGGKLADQWASTVLTPAFVFWSGGFLAWITYSGLKSLKPVEMQFDQLSPILQGTFLIGGLLVIVASSLVVQRLDMTFLRFLEGYWPHWLTWLLQGIVSLRSKSQDKARLRYYELLTKEEQNTLSPKEYKERIELELKLRLVPIQLRDCMPTKLGNILRAAENRPIEKYGLVTAICWPRLWLLLPDSIKIELAEARASLDTAARIFLWSILFLVWTVWAWWVPIVTLVVALWAYRWALSAAEVYSDLLESTFDLHRFALYEALRWPIPKKTSLEPEQGSRLTGYLFRGLVDKPVTFRESEKTK